MTSFLFRSSSLIRVGVLCVALVVLGACGGPEGADAPEDAATDAFCEVIGDLDTSDPGKLVEKMAKTGTPRAITDDARAGFEVMIDKATADEISDADQEKVTAFIAYVASTCGGTAAD